MIALVSFLAERDDRPRRSSSGSPSRPQPADEVRVELPAYQRQNQDEIRQVQQEIRQNQQEIRRIWEYLLLLRPAS